MKRITALAMAISILLATCFCGTALAAADLTEADFAGEWIDVTTGYTLIFSSGYKAEFHKRSNTSWNSGTCEYNDGVLYDIPGMDGTLSVKMEDGVVSLENDEYCFKRFADMPMTELALGEKGSDDRIEIAVESVEFVDDVPNKVYIDHGGYTDYISPHDGEVYACVTYTITNINKAALSIGGLDHSLKYVLDYDDGFLFTTSNDNPEVLVADEASSICMSSSLSGQEVSLQPLASKTLSFYFRCPEAVANNADKTLDVVIVSYYDVVPTYYKWTVRTGE